MAKVGIGFIVCLLVLILSAPCLFAAEKQANWETKMLTGIKNVFTCWLEIPRQIKKVNEEADPVAAITYGTARGIAFTIARVIVGVFDIVSCPLPPYDKPMMAPDYSI